MSLLDRAKEMLQPAVKEAPAEASRGETANPANATAAAVTGRTRIPLSVPRLKLEVPKLPGYVLQWFADRPGRIRQAQEAGYEFVTPDEIKLNNANPADSVFRDGNTDLGNAVSIYGGVSEQGTAERLYLMKVQEAWWLEDEKVRADRNESVAQAIRGGNDLAQNPHEERSDSNLRYLGTGTGPRRKQASNIFTRKRG